jgi:hypothetical protein
MDDHHQQKQPSQYGSFSEFYPYYLSEHKNRRCRQCHYLGSTMTIFVLLLCIYYQAWSWLWLLPVIGYGFAWFGHYVFEKNRPATFKYPVYSFFGDWVMFWQMLTGKLRR